MLSTVCQEVTATSTDVCHVLVFTHANVLISLRFNGHFPGETALASVYWSKGWWRWWWQLDHCSYKSCKAPVKLSLPTNPHPVFFYRPDALPVARRPTNSVKALKGKISHSMDLLTPGPSSPGVFQLCLWPLIAPWGRVVMPLINPCMSVPNANVLIRGWYHQRCTVTRGIWYGMVY